METGLENVRVRERDRVDLTRTWDMTSMVTVGSSFSLSSA